MIGLDKARKTYRIGDLLRSNLLTGSDTQCLGNMETKLGKEAVADKLVESKRSGKHPATRIRNAQHIEITLQNTIFSGIAVYGYISQIEKNLFSAIHKRKITAIDIYRTFSVELHRPTITLYIHQINGITFGIEK